MATLFEPSHPITAAKNQIIAASNQITTAKHPIAAAKNPAAADKNEITTAIILYRSSLPISGCY